MNAESQLLIGALRQAVTGVEVQRNTAVDWAAFLKLARSHGVEGLAYMGLKELNLPQEAVAQLSGAYHRAIFREAQQDHVRTRLSAMLAEAGVDHVFLKGAVLKYDYPVPALRTMSDMDILVSTEDYEAVDRVSLALSGNSLAGDGNHRSFEFPGGVLVEFHPNIVHHASRLAAGINPGWQLVQPGEGCRELTEEGLYLTVMTHLADHFLGGGIGVRFVLDIWVMRKLRAKPMNSQLVLQTLDTMGLGEFAGNIEALADLWFGDGQPTPVLEELGDYILTSGTHGFSERAILNSVSLSAGGRLGALWEKAFYPRQELEDRYPWCSGKTYLLPAAWCARAFRAVTKHGHLVRKWSKDTGRVSKEEIARQREMLRRFGVRLEENK